MKLFIKNIFILSTFLFVVAFCLDLTFTKVFKNGKTVKVQWLDRIENEKYDYAIIGSSRAWWNIDTKLIDSAKNLNGINLSNNHFGLSEILLRLKRFYANNNEIENLILQLDYKSLFSQTGEFSSTVYNYLPYLDDELTYEHLSKRSFEWKIYKNIPFWRYIEYNFQWGIEEMMITSLNLRKSIFDNQGNYFSHNQFHGDSTFNISAISISANSDILEIINFCKKNNINLTTFTAPYYNASISEKTANKFNKTIDSLHIQHFDYSHIYKNIKTYFNDNTHLSLKGGKVFTDLLIRTHF